MYLATYSPDGSLRSRVVSCFNGTVDISEKVILRQDKRELDLSRNEKELKFNKLYEKIMSFKYSKELAYTFLKELRQFKNITARLLEAYLYFISGNAARSERILLEITKKSLLEHSFSSDFRAYSYDDQKAKIFSLLEVFKNEQFHPIVLSNLLYYFYYGSTGPFSLELLKRFPLNESISNLRKRYNSAIYGRPFPYVWSSAILKNGSLNEYSRYIDGPVLKSFLERKDLGALLFFVPLDSIDRAYQSLVLTNFKILEETPGMFYSEILFNLLLHDVFFKFVTVHSSFKFGLLVNVKRRTYIEALKRVDFYEYALFKLISIGDIRGHEIRNLINIKGY